MLTYAYVAEHKDPLGLADFDAYLDGRELPSELAKQEKKRERAQEVLSNAAEFGGEVG